MKNDYATPEVIEIGELEELIRGDKYVSVEASQPGLISTDELAD